MTGHRRYGTTSKSTAAAARLPTQSAATDKQKPIPLLTGERREIRVPSTDDDGERGGGGRHSSEREPLLLDLQGPVEGNGRGGSSGGGGPGVGTRAAFSAGSSRRDNGRVLTALLILNYMIGSGILNAPQVFEKSGISSATVLFIVAGIATWFGLVILVNASEMVHPKGRALRGGSGAGAELLIDGPIGGHGGGRGEYLEDVDFAHLARDTLGFKGSLSVDLAIVVQCIGDVSSYVILIGSLTGSLLDELFGEAASSAWWASFSVLAPVMIFLFVFPASLIRHLSNLRWLAVFSFCAISSVVVLVVIGGPIYAAEERSEPDHDPDLDASVVWVDWTGSLAKLGSIVFSVASSPAAMMAYTAMNPRSPRVWQSVSGWTVVIGCCLCYTMGLAGYLSFRDAVDGDILSNFSGTVASIFKAIVVVHLVVYTPSEVIVMRHSLFALRGKDVMSSDFNHVAGVTFTILVVIVSMIVGLNAVGVAQGDLFGYILDITGGVAISATSFVLPGLIYLGATSEDGLLFDDAGARLRYTGCRRACKVLVVFGVVVMILVPIGVALEIAGI